MVGWFHGALEFGPRALGGRSLLADPRDPEMRDRLNRLVKKREAFRPFAPSVLAAHAAEHFDLDHPSPYMLETCRVTSPLDLPAITHVDGSARPQTVDPAIAPRFAALLEAFRRRTGCPLLVNTSFNVRGEPIVASPVDALSCMGVSGIDALVLEDFLIDRDRLPANWADLLPAWRERARSGFARGIERDQRGPLHVRMKIALRRSRRAPGHPRGAAHRPPPPGDGPARRILGHRSSARCHARRSRSASGSRGRWTAETVWVRPDPLPLGDHYAATPILRPQEGRCFPCGSPSSASRWRRAISMLPTSRPPRCSKPSSGPSAERTTSR